MERDSHRGQFRNPRLLAECSASASSLGPVVATRATGKCRERERTLRGSYQNTGGQFDPVGQVQVQIL